MIKLNIILNTYAFIIDTLAYTFCFMLHVLLYYSLDMHKTNLRKQLCNISNIMYN